MTPLSWTWQHDVDVDAIILYKIIPQQKTNGHLLLHMCTSIDSAPVRRQPLDEYNTPSGVHSVLGQPPPIE